MKKSTIKKYITILEDIKKSGKSIKAYCEENGISVANIYQVKSKLEETDELYHEFMSLYNSITGRKSYNEELIEVETSEDEIDKVTVVRNSEDNKIIEYKVYVPVRDSRPFEATLSRKEIEDIYGLYTYYGGNITARNVANEFPRFTLPEVKKIIRAFGITKDSAWFPLHLLEEMNEEELSQYRLNLKERAAFKYADSRREIDYNKQIRDLTSRLNKAEAFTNFLENLSNKIYDQPKVTITTHDSGFITKDTMILYLSDMHIGAKVESGSLFSNPYDMKEVYTRIDYIIEHLKEIGNLKKLIIANLADSIDGFNNTTSRNSQIMPQNMDNMEQAKNFVDSIMYLFRRLIEEEVANEYSYIAVKCGNHPGTVEWVLNQLVASKLKEAYGDIETKISDSMFLEYKVNNQLFLMCHGREEKFMKSHYPLNLDNKTEGLLTDYIFHTYTVSPETQINVVSGDLHNEAMNRGKFFKYWKVGSFFGSSDYCMVNYGNTPAHVNYHIIKDNALLFGTIELQ